METRCTHGHKPQAIDQFMGLDRNLLLNKQEFTSEVGQGITAPYQQLIWWVYVYSYNISS
jgi:hypothetical protein